MSIGLSTYNISASELIGLAVAADEASFESPWLGEHVVLPLDYASDHPTSGGSGHQHHIGPIVDPSTTLVDPLVALSACAAVTSRIRLATGVFILPLRHPLLTARMTLTLQDAAGGRFMLGVGSGWLREEFDALDVPFDDRATRMDETIAILRQAWNAEQFSHAGTFFSFGTVRATPKPVDVPLILGGNTERALRRAADLGDGWFSSGTPPLEDAGRLRDRCSRYVRPVTSQRSRCTCASPLRTLMSSRVTTLRASSTSWCGQTNSGPLTEISMTSTTPSSPPPAASGYVPTEPRSRPLHKESYPHGADRRHAVRTTTCTGHASPRRRAARSTWRGRTDHEFGRLADELPLAGQSAHPPAW